MPPPPIKPLESGDTLLGLDVNGDECRFEGSVIDERAAAAVQPVEYELNALLSAISRDEPAFGPSTALQTGTNLSAGQWVIHDPAPRDMLISRVDIMPGTASGELRLSTWTVAGARTSRSDPMTVATGQLRSIVIDPPFFVPAGERIGREINTDGVAVYVSGTDPNGGYYKVALGATDSTPGVPPNQLYTGARLQIRLYESEVVPTTVAIDEITAQVAALKSMNTRTTSFVGRQGQPSASTSSTGGSSIALQGPIATDGHVRRIQLRSGSGSGTGYLMRYRADGALLKPVGAEISFTIAASSDVDITGLDFPFDGEDWLVLYGPANSIAYTETTVDNSGFFSAGGKDSVINTSGGISTGTRFEARITVETIGPKTSAFLNRYGRPATGYDTIVEQFWNADAVKVQIGFQNNDDQDPQAGFTRVHGGINNPGTRFDLTTYQYGGTVKGFGPLGDTFELQLSSDTEATRKPVLSIRDRLGRAGMGSAIQTRSGDDLWGFGIWAWDEGFPFVGPFDNVPSLPKLFWLDHCQADGGWAFSVQRSELARFTAQGFQFKGRASAPTPDADSYIIWQKEAGGADDGDLMVTINSGGFTKTATLIDFSAV